MLSEKIKVHLSKVVLIKDAFLEETVTNGMQIRVFPEGKPILKPDGYCLFLNMGQEEFEVEIDSPVYRRRTVRLKADGGEQTEEIFLYPSKAYPVKSGSTWVCGSVLPETTLWFHVEESVRECKLLCDYQKEDERISIFIKGKNGRGKKNWYIWDKEKKTGEYFQVQDISDEQEVYALKRPLKSDYRKKNTVLYPAFLYMTDETGELYLLLDHLKDENYELHYSCCKKGEKICGKVEIQGRKQNMLNIC